MRTPELAQETGANLPQLTYHDHRHTQPTTTPPKSKNDSHSSTYSPPRKTPHPLLTLGLLRRWHNTCEG
jgi:hypothetical protein